MKSEQKMKKGTKVRNQYGEVRTVFEVRDNSVLTYEEPNNVWYHISKLTVIK